MLRSKVARRMFLLFVLCALLPLVVLALVSFFEVRTHLDSLSERRLHQASKSAGMTVVERMSFLETGPAPASRSASSRTRSDALGASGRRTSEAG